METTLHEDVITRILRLRRFSGRLPIETLDFLEPVVKDDSKELARIIADSRNARPLGKINRDGVDYAVLDLTTGIIVAYSENGRYWLDHICTNQTRNKFEIDQETINYLMSRCSE